MEYYLIVDGVMVAQTHKIKKFFKKINDFDLIIKIGFCRGDFLSWIHKNVIWRSFIKKN